MISRAEAFKTWLKIGLLSFGGPAGQIALMHKILVEEKKWIGERRFLHALNYCMLLPGPEAMQLATYIGWLMHRTWGGITAGLLFILPGATLMMILSAIYAAYHKTPLVDALFFGLKSAVLVLVVEAVIRIGKKALHNTSLKILAALSFIALFFFGVPFPFVILAAGVIGYVAKWPVNRKDAQDEGASIIDKMIENGEAPHILPSTRRAAVTCVIWLALWAFPLSLCLHLHDTVLLDIGLFFSKMAVVTFGGAYAVLAYVAQQAVENYKWLLPVDMINGLGLAETTPGPLILVLQYVGYLAAYNTGGHLAGVAGALMALWVTFTPCFLWIFLGAPYIERIRGNAALSSSLTAITAAVTGVILNLAIWFALHVLFAKVEAVDWNGIKLYAVSSPDIPAACLAALAAICTFKLKWSIPATLGICAALGLAVKLL